jgi:hypothetical protein
MVGVRLLRLPRPPTRHRVVEVGVWNGFGRWMRGRGWLGFTLPLPFLTIIFYWLARAEEGPEGHVRVHEFVHARQHDRFFLFGLRYLIALVTDGGYRRNRFEQEAFRIEAEARLTGLPAWATNTE